jgi:hypothetical protein
LGMRTRRRRRQRHTLFQASSPAAFTVRARGDGVTYAGQRVTASGQQAGWVDMDRYGKCACGVLAEIARRSWVTRPWESRTCCLAPNALCIFKHHDGDMYWRQLLVLLFFRKLRSRLKRTLCLCCELCIHFRSRFSIE